jgi:hypothetical protein
MRTFLSRLIAFSVMFVTATALFLFIGSISNTGLVTTAYAAGSCKDGTVASYMGTSCSQGNTVFNWNSYTCTSNPKSICDGLGTKGANLKIRLDPSGPHTLLLGATRLWNVTAGQNVDVVIKGTVAGATTNQNWPHFVGLRGQTGDGTEDNKTTVDCASHGTCKNGPKGVSDILCTATGPAANCTQQKKIDAYLVARTTFDPAMLSNPYAMTVEIKLNGGTNGTATLYSVGLHVGD